MPESGLSFDKVYDKFRSKANWKVTAEKGEFAKKVKLVGEPGDHSVIARFCTTTFLDYQGSAWRGVC